MEINICMCICNKTYKDTSWSILKIKGFFVCICTIQFAQVMLCLICAPNILFLRSVNAIVCSPNSVLLSAK